MLAAAIQNMDGIGGKPGWAWIFILVRFWVDSFTDTADYIIIIGRAVHASDWSDLLLPHTVNAAGLYISDPERKIVGLIRRLRQ